MGPDESKQRFELVGEVVSIFCRGRRWYANFQLDGKQHRPSLKTTSKKEARRQALRLEARILEGRFGREAQPAILTDVVADYKQYLRTEGRAAKTLQKYDGIFDRVLDLAARRHVKRVSEVTLIFVDAYRNERVDAGAASKTVYTESVVVRQLINFALSRKMLTSDPLQGLKLKKPAPTEQPCWTYEQLQKILAASPADIVPALTILAETGMRFGELAWLTWDDIDFTANVLRIRPKPGWKPKTGDRRAVPLTPALQHLLQSLPRRGKWVVTMPPSPAYRRYDRQWSERRLLTALQRVLKELKLPGKLHTFRHTFISNALQRGTPVAVVRAWVGHVDDQVLRLYTHVHDDASQAAMQRLSEANTVLQKGPNGDTEVNDGESAQFQHNGQSGGKRHDAT